MKRKTAVAGAPSRGTWGWRIARARVRALSVTAISPRASIPSMYRSRLGGASREPSDGNAKAALYRGSLGTVAVPVLGGHVVHEELDTTRRFMCTRVACTHVRSAGSWAD